MCESCQGREVVVLGDFNLPSLQWSAGDEMFVGVSQKDRLFFDCFVAAALTQWVTEATFVTSGNSLDLFLTSEVDRVGDIKVLAPFPRCDHSPLVCDYLFNSDLDADEEEEAAV